MDKLFINIGELLTMDYSSPYLRGKEMNELPIIKDAYLLVEDGKVASYGYMKDFHTSTKEAIDCKGRLVTPGLVDSHTHLVYAGSREQNLWIELRDYPTKKLLEEVVEFSILLIVCKRHQKKIYLLKATNAFKKLLVMEQVR